VPSPRKASKSGAPSQCRPGPGLDLADPCGKFELVVTRVELEHRGFDSYGDRAEEIRDSVGGEGGWSALLACFAAVASA